MLTFDAIDIVVNNQNAKTRSGAQPASYSMGTGVLPLGGKRLEREADH